jgi:chemotaxis protein CheC
MPASPPLTAEQLRSLKEIGYLGMGKATSALSQLLGYPLTLTMSRVSILPLEQIPAHIGGKERVVVGLFLKVRGDVTGHMLILLSRKSVASILRLLTGKKGEVGPILSEEEMSVLKEMANILASAYLSALGNHLKIPLIPSIPGLAFDMAGAVVDHLLIELGKKEREAMIVETHFEAPGEDISGRLLLFVDHSSMSLLLSSPPPL